MPTEKKVNNVQRTGATVVPGLRSHANDPFFVKKAEDAKIAVSKLTLPGVKKK